MIALEAAAALAAGTGPGPRTIPGARPRVVSRESCVKQVVLGGSYRWRTLLDALGVGDAWDVNDALRVGDAWDVNDALRVGDALGVADDGHSLLVCTRVANASHANPLIGTWAS